jgi:hypothetical protein
MINHIHITYPWIFQGASAHLNSIINKYLGGIITRIGQLRLASLVGGIRREFENKFIGLRIQFGFVEEVVRIAGVSSQFLSACAVKSVRLRLRVSIRLLDVRFVCFRYLPRTNKYDWAHFGVAAPVHCPSVSLHVYSTGTQLCIPQQCIRDGILWERPDL